MSALCHPENADIQARVRPLRRVDLPDVEAHLLRLDAESRRDRFGICMSDRALKSYAETCFRPDVKPFGFVEAGGICGLGELHAVQGGGSEIAAEASFSVEPRWRRRGVASALMARVLSAARFREIPNVRIFCCARNQAMLGLARKFSSELTYDLDEASGRFVIPAPAILSPRADFAFRAAA